MSFSDFMRDNAGEYILVLLSAWAVGVTSLDGFFLFTVSDAIGYWGRAVFVLVVEAFLLVVLYAASFQRKRVVFGAVAYVAIAAVMVVVALVASSGENPYEDAEGNYFYLAVLLAVVPAACFLLTRTLVGSAVWFVAAAFVCSVIQAFYECEELGFAILATATSLALIVHKNFRLGVEQADAATRPSVAGVFGSAVAPVAVVVGLASVIWFAIIAPLNPGVIDVKLITEYRSLPIEYFIGTAEEKPVLNLEMTTDDLVEGDPYTTDDLVEDPDSDVIIDSKSLLEQQQQEEQEEQESGSEAEGGESAGGGTEEALDEESLEPEYDTQSYSVEFPWIILRIVIAALLVALVLGYFIGRRVWRKKNLEKMLGLPPRQQVVQIYRFLLGRLGRLGFTIPVGSTVSEWSWSSRRSMDVLDEVAGVPFDKLTETYIACDYGKYEPTEEDVVPFVAYYLGFWQAAREQLGNFKYFFKSFRL